MGYNEQRGWPTSISDSGPSGVFASYGLVYDQGANTVGNLTSVSEADGSSVAYGYDALYRLSGYTRTGTSPDTEGYTYDPAGNWNTPSTALVYDNANKLTTYNYTDSGGSPQSQTYTYDDDGNMTYGALLSTYWSWLGGWTPDNKLTSLYFNNQDIDEEDIWLDNGYGADGLRKWSQPAQWDGTGAVTAPPRYYIYSGDTLIGEVNSDGTPVAAYTWGATGLVSEHRYDTATPESFWYSYGPQGETRQLTNSSGAVVDSYLYDPWGELVTTTGTDPNPFQFGGSAGYYTDPAAQGLVLCGQRWYAPDYRRWLNRDPEGYGGGANLYAYCGDDPVGGIDPSGTDEEGQPEKPGDTETDQDNREERASGGGVPDDPTLDRLGGAPGKEAEVEEYQESRSRNYSPEPEGPSAWDRFVELIESIGKGKSNSENTAASRAKTACKQFPDVEPTSLKEQIVLGAAKIPGNGAKRIMGTMTDPRLQDINVIKMQYVHRSLDGTKTTVHWFRDMDTGSEFGFKFK